jgi:hypothetical protein
VSQKIKEIIMLQNNDITSNYTLLYTGRHFVHTTPTADQVDIEDVAHALSMLCRFGGHTRQFYSVAEHCCYVCDYCPYDIKLWGLLHDASEAYLVDIPRPVKPLLSNYKQLESAVMDCVAERFGLPKEIPPEVKVWDNRVLISEMRALMHEPDFIVQEHYPHISGLYITCWSPEEAEKEFLYRFHTLYQGT